MFEDLPGYDAWLTNPDKYETEPAVIEQCYWCKEDLYEGDECYFMNGVYYCKECIEEARVTLDAEEEPHWEEGR
jgi:hypothetical protein